MIGARIAYKRAKEASARSKKKVSTKSDLIAVISDILNSEEDSFGKKKNAIYENEENNWNSFYEISKPLPSFHREPSFHHQAFHTYLELSWFVKDNITSQHWFEVFILVCIVSVAISTGLSLDGYSSPDIELFDYYVAHITFYVFVFEVIIKIISFGDKPYLYFVDKGGNGFFNCFDFTLSALSIALIGQSSAGAIRTLRLARLVRLLTIIKNVPELKVIVIGLIAGLRSVVYIVALLILVIYLYAVLGVIILSSNDRANFGNVPIAMMTLFQVSTLTSWTTLAYVNWHGCDTYPDGYEQVDSDKDLDYALTWTGRLPTWECLKGNRQPIFTFIYFTSFTIIAAMVVMSLFIGVITMGMFDAVEEMKTMKAAINYKTEVLKLKREMFPLEGEGTELTMAVDRAMKRWPTRMYQHKFQEGWRKQLHTFWDRSIKLEKSKGFNIFITLCIAISGVVIGLQVDEQGNMDALNAVDFATLLVFTFEMVLKMVVQKEKPWKYFDSSWNRFDFIIVINGWLDFFKLAISRSVAILRLLRMLRVFRLARSLPRLRSIVESLIKGFGSVLWILVLMVVFNYIFGCLGIMLFKDNDPFYFGSVLQAVFSVYQVETLDTWDIMLRVNMYGCKEYPGGYPLTIGASRYECDESQRGLGWVAASYFIVVVVFGGLILPTMLIGIVTISFEESFRQSEADIKNQVEAKIMIQMVQEDMPNFFSDVRVELLKFVFNSIDVDDSGSLDINEVAPLIRYISTKHLHIELKNEDIRALVHLFDDDNTDDINFGELLVIIRYIIRARNLGKLVRRSSRIDHDAAKSIDNNQPPSSPKKQLDKNDPSTLYLVDQQNKRNSLRDELRKSLQELEEYKRRESDIMEAERRLSQQQQRKAHRGSKQVVSSSSTSSSSGSDSEDDSFKEMDIEKFSLSANRKKQKSSFIRNMVSEDEEDSEEDSTAPSLKEKKLKKEEKERIKRDKAALAEATKKAEEQAAMEAARLEKEAAIKEAEQKRQAEHHRVAHYSIEPSLSTIISFNESFTEGETQDAPKSFKFISENTRKEDAIDELENYSLDMYNPKKTIEEDDEDEKSKNEASKEASESKSEDKVRNPSLLLSDIDSHISDLKMESLLKTPQPSSPDGGNAFTFHNSHHSSSTLTSLFREGSTKELALSTLDTDHSDRVHSEESKESDLSTHKALHSPEVSKRRSADSSHTDLIKGLHHHRDSHHHHRDSHHHHRDSHHHHRDSHHHHRDSHHHHRDSHHHHRDSHHYHRDSHHHHRDSHHHHHHNGESSSSDKAIPSDVHTLQVLVKKLQEKVDSQKEVILEQKKENQQIHRELQVQRLITKKYIDDLDRLQTMNDSLIELASDIDNDEYTAHYVHTGQHDTEDTSSLHPNDRRRSRKQVLKKTDKHKSRRMFGSKKVNPDDEDLILAAEKEVAAARLVDPLAESVAEKLQRMDMAQAIRYEQETNPAKVVVDPWKDEVSGKLLADSEAYYAEGEGNVEQKEVVEAAEEKPKRTSKSKWSQFQFGSFRVDSSEHATDLGRFSFRKHTPPLPKQKTAEEMKQEDSCEPEKQSISVTAESIEAQGVSSEL